MDERIIIEKMKERGFFESYRILDGKGNLISLAFCYKVDEKENEKRFPIPAYGCSVDNQEQFEFSYCIPGSVNILKMEKVSGFWDDDHFDRLASKFEHQAAVLQKYCNI